LVRMRISRRRVERRSKEKEHDMICMNSISIFVSLFQFNETLLRIVNECIVC
jgi:hypothetical protein